MHRHGPSGTGSADPRDLSGTFRHEIEIQVRFADTDGMRHVNNAKYLTYCEIARIRYWTDVTGEGFSLGTEGVESLILAEARITYRAQAFYGDVVTVQTRATRIGRTSFTLEHRLVAVAPDGPARLVAVSESVLVRFDYDSMRPVPLSPEHVATIEAFEGRSLVAGTPAG
jgi:acyl-CoA thioester hydrolase